MEFCPDCNNLLHSTLGKNAEGVAMLVANCKTCQFVKPAVSNMLFSRNVIRKVEETGEVKKRPSLPLTMDTKCFTCQGLEASFFKWGDEMMFICSVCQESWMYDINGQ